MMDMVNGQIRVRAWPRKRGQAGTPDQIANRKKFAEVQRASRYIAPQTYAQIVDATARTPLLPRDIITMMMYNRVAAFTLPDGRTLYPMPVKADVSEALDALSQTDGDTLVRENGVWVGKPYAGGGGGGGNAHYTLLTANYGAWLDGGSGVAPPWANAPLNPMEWADLAARGIRPTIAGTYLAEVSISTEYAACRGGWFTVDGSTNFYDGSLHPGGAYNRSWTGLVVVPEGGALVQAIAHMPGGGSPMVERSSFALYGPI